MEPEEQGPLGKLGNSCVMMCLGVVMFPLSLFLLGANEQNYVCQQDAFVYADEHAQVVSDCTSAGASVADLVFFSCPLNKSELKHYGLAFFNSQIDTSDPLADVVDFQSVSASQTVEMVQCIESCKDEKYKENGQNRKRYVCDYTLDYSATDYTTKSFNTLPESIQRRNQVCPNVQAAGDRNPGWPSNLAYGKNSDYMQSVKAGGFELNSDLIDPLGGAGGLQPDTPVNLSPSAAKLKTAATLTTVAQSAQPWLTSTDPVGFGAGKQALTASAGYLYTCAGGVTTLGCVRISYKQSVSTQPSVFSAVGAGGITEPATIPKSWGGCGGDWQRIYADTMTKEAMIQRLNDENDSTVWLIRFAGLIACWLSIYCCLQPISAAADVVGDCANLVPCCGGYLEDFIEGVVTWVLCAISCPIGCSCGLFVIACMWLFMRPLYGGILMVVCLLLCCCSAFIHQKFAEPKKKGRRKKHDEEEGSSGSDYDEEDDDEPEGQGRGMAPPRKIAKGFVDALTEEFVDGREGAVGDFHDEQSISPSITEMLDDVEGEVRDSGNPERKIDQIKRRWGL